MFRTLFARTLALLALLLTLVTTALAHPHVFVKAKTDVVFDSQGRIIAIRQAWRFDDAYSAFATQGLPHTPDGSMTRETLAPLAKLNMDSLKEYAYFTFLDVGKDDLDFQDPKKESYWLQWDDGLLTLYFELPTLKPIEIKGKPTRVEVYDPTYFVDFEFVDDKDTPVRLINAPAGCTLKITRPEALDPAIAAELAQIPADQREVPPELMVVTQTLINGADITCPN